LSWSAWYTRGVIPGRCPRCLYRPEHCLCPDIPRLVTRTRVVILRHHTEQTRSSNSGRLAHLALADSVLVDVHGPERAALAPPIGPGAWLVFPEGEPRRVAPAPPPSELVFLDATWSQAKRMRQRTPALRGLPILALDVTAAALRMRKSPGPGRVSTIEAVAEALRLVEGGDAPDALDRLFALAIERMGRAGRVVSGRG
jgi:DTW domain-containing protein YfiP